MSTSRKLYKDLPLESLRSIPILTVCGSDVYLIMLSALFDAAELTHTYSRQEAVIQLSLRVVNLDDEPCYHALSSTWGPPTREAAARFTDGTPACRINCNGESLLITQNLFDCLQQLIRVSDSIEFWIDAICTDQESQEENQQVNLMAEIYQHAKEVTIWLGKADEQTDLACAFIKKFATRSR